MSAFDPWDELPELPEEELLPPYLRDAGASMRTWGELSYSPKQKAWVIKGDPAVCQLAKRLFPGCGGRGRGVARFAAGRRALGDLHWLMLRYPLAIAAKDRARWEEGLAAARAWAVARERAQLRPLSIEPKPGSFHGNLMEFQKAGAGYLIDNPRCLLADEMGLGKTVQALAALSERGEYPVLVVVPAHLMTNWRAEIGRFLRIGGKEPSVHAIRGLTPYELPGADIYLVHYLLLRGWKHALPQVKWSAIIFDEIQELRHAGTEKYSAASLLSDSCETVYGLSGTPIYNRGGEIWNVINILDFHALGDYESFTREWCYGYGNDLVAKPDLLGEHLRREGLILRRTKEQVLGELPPKRRLVQTIDFDDAAYAELMRPAMALVGELRGELSAFDRARVEDALSQRERQATGIAKAPYVAAFVRALIDGGERALLFAHHHEVMDAYKKALKACRPVFITGRETQAQKDKSVESFMSGKTNLCVVSLRAAAGLNLQRATCVVFGELDWSPAVHSQAEDRAHRIGQKDSVLCYYLVSPRGSDQDVQEALGLKVSQFTGLMGDRVQSQDEVLKAQVEARETMRRIAARLARIGLGDTV